MTSRSVGDPRPGFFKTRIVKHGTEVPAQIKYGPSRDPETGDVLDRPWLWEAIVNGEHVRPPSPDPVAAGIFRIWEFATEISQQEFRFLQADREWSAKHAPDSPEANPNEAVQVGSLPPEYF